MSPYLFNFDRLEEKDYLFISKILKNRGTIIYPTETIYGVGGKGFDKEVTEKIFQIKNRPQSKSFLLLFKNRDMLEKYVVIKSKLENKIIEKYWPGEITLILQDRHGNSNIACRISSHPFVQKLFEFIDFPIISTSANLSGEKYNGNFERIYQIFKNKVDIFVNNGNRDGEPSTIVKVENSRVKIIRKGKINTI